jgi:endonuclease/exonuclease/phosphatase (EEP) superfamily protein YafD
LFTALYALVLLALTVSNVVGPERWWPGSLNLYMPQWPWALPIALLLPWYLIRDWRWCWAPLLMVAWVFGPIMGFSFGLSRFTPRVPGQRLRIITYNVKWGARDAQGVLANMAAADADVIVMQHSGGVLDGRLSALRRPGWRSRSAGQFTVLSRYPISSAALVGLLVNGQHDCLRCVLRVGTRPVTLYDVHFETPRFALGSIADRGAAGATEMQENAALRQQEAAGLVAQMRSATGPFILAGDLNAPVQSRACQALFRCGLRDAFCDAGLGYGYTYGQSTVVRRPYVRIDHILVSPEWRVLSCRAGSPRGSDHSPVVADLLLPDSPEGAPR